MNEVTMQMIDKLAKDIDDFHMKYPGDCYIVGLPTRKQIRVTLLDGTVVLDTVYYEEKYDDRIQTP